MHDALNLAWKLNLAIRGIARSELLGTYEHERRKVAQDLINFDYEHANAFHEGDPKALAQNFLKNVRFISGVGAEYTTNILNSPSSTRSALQPGSVLTPAKVTRYIDANPVDIQLDIPMLGQFRTYFMCTDLKTVMPFLQETCDMISTLLESKSLDSSYAKKQRTPNESDEYTRPRRYLFAGNLITPALVTRTEKCDFEIFDLPQLLRESPWTVYLDDCAAQNTSQKYCHEKWIGEMAETELVIVNVRPDGYIGCVQRWDVARDNTVDAAESVRGYYSSFLHL